jgi:hypothetical protein
VRFFASIRAILTGAGGVLPHFKHGSVTDWMFGIDKTAAGGFALVQTIVAKQSGRGRYD